MSTKPAKTETKERHTSVKMQKTDIGTIPTDWTVARLKSLVDPDRSIRYGIVQPGKYDPTGRYMVRGQDYSKGWCDPVDVFRVSEPIERRYQNARVQCGDLLVTIVGASTGKVAVVPDWLDGANLTQTTARVAVRRSHANSRYCAYVLESWYGTDQVLNYMKGGAQPGLNCGDLEKFWVPLPPAKEQEAIAEALSDADALIESLEDLIAKKRAIKQGAVQELLSGRRRLPGFSESWRQVSLGELLSKMANGLVYRPASRDGIPVTRIETIAAGFVDYGRTGMAEPVSCAEQYRMQPGDILYSHINSVDHIGKVALYRGESELYHGMNLLLLRCNEAVDPRFLYQTLASEPLRQTARTLAKQAVSQASINMAEMRSIQVRLPRPEEQLAIVGVLSEMDAGLSENEVRLTKARQIKQGMLQDLLTGQVRLV